MLLNFLLVAIFAACVALLHGERTWSNALRLVNVVTAALLATNFWEPLSDFLTGLMPALSTAWDFLAIWLLFLGLAFALRAATEHLSQVRVRFLPIADRLGGLFLAASTGWVMVCFTLMTLHMAPLSRNFLNGNFQPEKAMFLGMAPDRMWLAFVQKASRGSLARGGSDDDMQSERFVFDPKGEFLLKYAARRIRIEQNVAAGYSVFSDGTK
jgi:hypothetical protein